MTRLFGRNSESFVRGNVVSMEEKEKKEDGVYAVRGTYV